MKVLSALTDLPVVVALMFLHWRLLEFYGVLFGHFGTILLFIAEKASTRMIVLM